MLVVESILPLPFILDVRMSSISFSSCFRSSFHYGTSSFHTRCSGLRNVQSIVRRCIGFLFASRLWKCSTLVRAPGIHLLMLIALDRYFKFCAQNDAQKMPGMISFNCTPASGSIMASFWNQFLIRQNWQSLVATAVGFSSLACSISSSISRIIFWFYHAGTRRHLYRQSFQQVGAWRSPGWPGNWTSAQHRPMIFLVGGQQAMIGAYTLAVSFILRLPVLHKTMPTWKLFVTCVFPITQSFVRTFIRNNCASSTLAMFSLPACFSILCLLLLQTLACSSIITTTSVLLHCINECMILIAGKAVTGNLDGCHICQRQLHGIRSINGRKEW